MLAQARRRAGQGAFCQQGGYWDVLALLVVADRRGWNLHDRTLAVIGVGHIGSLVSQYAHSLGLKLLLCDPPLREVTGDARYRDLSDVLDADILTFHVPLTAEGPYPTMHLLERQVLERLAPRHFLINTARGPVFSGTDLAAALRGRRLSGAVLDVWEGEPQIDFSLLDDVEVEESQEAAPESLSQCR